MAETELNAARIEIDRFIKLIYKSKYWLKFPPFTFISIQVVSTVGLFDLEGTLDWVVVGFSFED